MSERRKMVHDLALAYVREKFRSAPDQNDLQTLINLYLDAVIFIVNHWELAEAGYYNADGKFIV